MNEVFHFDVVRLFGLIQIKYSFKLYVHLCSVDLILRSTHPECKINNVVNYMWFPKLDEESYINLFFYANLCYLNQEYFLKQLLIFCPTALNIYAQKQILTTTGSIIFKALFLCCI